jgi:hypothetical protein
VTQGLHRWLRMAGLLLSSAVIAACGGGDGDGGGGPPPPSPPPPVSGRNDSIGTATTLTNGSFAASISPSGHPSTVFNPDEDFYGITTTATSTVTIDIDAEVNGSPMDSVIEIVDANGLRLNTCSAPNFNSPCMNDDETPGDNLDSLLQVQVTGATTFYVHVVEFRGDARPDHLYTIVVSRIN